MLSEPATAVAAVARTVPTVTSGPRAQKTLRRSSSVRPTVQGRGRIVQLGHGLTPDALPIFEVPERDRMFAREQPYRWRYSDIATGYAFLIECPREIGDRHEWPRRWDLEILRRNAR